MTDRHRLTWRQTFFKRVISLSTARWFFSLLKEPWWRERSADGVVTDLCVMQVRGHRVAGLPLEEDFSSLWVVEIVKDVGLITSERRVIGQRARLLIWRSASGILPRWSPHGRGRYKSRFRQKKKRQEKHTEGRERTNDQVAHMDDNADETKRAPTLEPCKLMFIHQRVYTAWKITCEVCHSSRVKCPFVILSVIWCLVSMYRIWILGSKLLRSNNHTCLIIGLLHLIIILITASLSSNTYNIAMDRQNLILDDTLLMWNNRSNSLSKRILNWQLSNSWLALRFCDIQLRCSFMVQQNTRLHQLINGSPFLHDRQTRTDLTTDFLLKSDKLVCGPLVLLAPEGTVVKRALCRWCRHWSLRHASTRHRVAGLPLEEDFSCLWVVEIVKDVGLITSERRVIGQRARLLIWRSASGILPRWSPHGRGRYKSRFRQKKKRQEKHTEGRERTNDQVAHMDDNADETKRAPTLEPCSVMFINQRVYTAWKNDVWGVSFVTCEVSFCHFVCHLVFGVNVPYLNLGVQVTSVNNQSGETLRVVDTCLIIGLLHLIIILITASLSSNTYNIAMDRQNLILDDTLLMWNNSEPSWLEPPLITEFQRSRAGIPSIRRPASKKKDFCFRRTMRNWSLFLAHPTCWHERVTSENAQESTWGWCWVFWISSIFRILKQSQSEMLCGVSHLTMLFEFTCVVNVRNQTCWTLVACSRPFCDGTGKLIHWP